VPRAAAASTSQRGRPLPAAGAALGFDPEAVAAVAAAAAGSRTVLGATGWCFCGEGHPARVAALHAARRNHGRGLAALRSRVAPDRCRSSATPPGAHTQHGPTRLAPYILPSQTTAYDRILSPHQQRSAHIHDGSEPFPICELPAGLLDRVVGCLELWDLAGARAACQTLRVAAGRRATRLVFSSPSLECERGGDVQVGQWHRGSGGAGPGRGGAALRRDTTQRRRQAEAFRMLARPPAAEALPHGLPDVPQRAHDHPGGLRRGRAARLPPAERAGRRGGGAGRARRRDAPRDPGRRCPARAAGGRAAAPARPAFGVARVPVQVRARF
jgi:hypothetical protein